MIATDTATSSIAGSTRFPRCRCWCLRCSWSSLSRFSALVERFFAPCPRGLEGALAEELAGVGASDVCATEGGVAFSGRLELAYHANLQSRLASRVLWEVGRGSYRSEHDIYKLAHDLDWPRHFRADRTLRVDVAATRSPLRSLEFTTLKIKDAVCDRHRDA